MTRSRALERQADSRMIAQRRRDPKAQLELANNYLLTAFLIGRAASPDERLQYDNKALAIAEKLYASETATRICRLAGAKPHELGILLDLVGTMGGVSQALPTRADTSNEYVGDREDPVRAKQESARIHYRIGAGYAQAGQSAEAVDTCDRLLRSKSPLSAAPPNDESLSRHSRELPLSRSRLRVGEFREASGMLQ